MTVITTRLIVAPDGSLATEIALPPGRHSVTVTVAETLPPRLGVQDMPRHERGWNDDVSLRRVDLYGDDGRLR